MIQIKKLIIYFMLVTFIFSKEIDKVADLIFKNEAGGKKENLIVWNKGEEFPSLGIGHFIWYPKNYEGNFEESYPKLKNYLILKGYVLPSLLNNLDAPWDTKEEFEKFKMTKEFKELTDFLYETRGVQADFIKIRAEESLNKILIYAENPEKIKKAFYEVYNSPFGAYPIIDYVNFKGEGIKDTEKYKNQGWGLLQVLEQVSENNKKISSTEKFIEGAKFVLTRRVKNSDPQRGEERWLKGWINRVETYKIEN